MKMNLFLLLQFSLVSLISFGQVPLEHKYSEPISVNPYSYFHLMPFEKSNGEVWYMAVYRLSDGSVPVIKIYNESHSLYKTVNLPSDKIYSIYSPIGSDNWFNTDSKVEFVITENVGNLPQPDTKLVAHLVNEDGVFLQAFDTITTYCNVNYYTVGNKKKLMINNNRNTYLIYDLLQPVTTGSINPTDDKSSFRVSNPSPNPSRETTRIEFELPDGAELGEILVYDTQGILKKKYTVDGTFNDLLLNNKDLPTGTYYYQLQSNGKASEAKKMMVIK